MTEMQTEKSCKEQRREYVAGYKYNTSIHPIAMAFTAPVKLLRLLWLVAFVAASTLLILQLGNLVVAYRKYPVQTKTTKMTKPILQFPAVTICNLNSMKKSKIRCSVMDGLAALDHDESEMWYDCLPGASLEGAFATDFDYYDSSEMDYDYYDDGFESGNGSRNGSGDTDDGSGFGEGYGSYDENFTMPMDDWGSGFRGIDLEALDLELDGGFEMAPSSDMGLLKGFIADIRENKTSREVFRNLVRHSKVSDFSDAKGILTITDAQARKYGYNRKEMIVQCSYDSTSCNETDFRRFYSSRYGNCFTFNTMLADEGTKTRLTQKYGPDSGLQVTLNVKADEYVGFLSEDYGVKVVVHSPYQYPDLLGQGFTATVGFKTQAAVKKHTIYRKKNPYESRCQDNISEEYRHVKVTPDNAWHTIGECEKACFATHLRECCGCRFVDGAYTKNMRNKGINPFNIMNSTHLECRERVAKRMLLHESKPESIRCRCTPSCKEEEFSHSLYFADWPTKALQGLLAVNSQNSKYVSSYHSYASKVGDFDGGVKEHIYAYSRSNLVRLHVYYENLVETISEEHPETTFNQIFADVGGTMGVYLGLSIMTFLEVLQFLCLCAWTRKDARDGGDEKE